MNLKWILLAILLVGICIRFINFPQSIYFGYDEARDAFISQDIYLKGELKLVGPTASALTGIHHGPFYYYLLGPLFLMDGGDPYLASVFFRLINAAGIVGVFVIGLLFFNPIIGLTAAFIYSLSYEQFIYAIFTGNPAVSNICWIVSFIGAGLIYKSKKKVLGLILMLLGGSLAAQFDMISAFLFIPVLLTLILLKRRVSLPLKKWVLILGLGFIPIYTYIAAEVKFQFPIIKSFLQIISSDFSTVPSGKSESTIFLTNFLGLFRSNIFDFNLSDGVIGLFLALTITYLLYKSRENKKYLIFIFWILSLLVFLFTRGFMPLYSYAGVGIGLIIGFSVLLCEVFQKNRILFMGCLILIGLSNITQSINQSTKGLVVGIKAQPGMLLTDEINLINKTYSLTNGQKFTIRTTNMPYNIQTVWAYLYNQYGNKKYGYLPFLENGNVAGFAGALPEPVLGTTCIRFLIREPVRGIPEGLIKKDEQEENYFSDIVNEEYFGSLLLQIRQAKDPKCHK